MEKNFCNHALAFNYIDNKYLYVSEVFKMHDFYLMCLRQGFVFQYCPCCGKYIDHSIYGKEVKKYVS